MNMKTRLTTLPAFLGLALTLASCSSEEPSGKTAPDGNAIRFAANTEYTRVADDITTNNLSKFNVYAYLDGSTDSIPYMNNVTVTKTSTNTWAYSPTAYWPSTGTLDFYAYAPEGWVPDTGPLRAITWDNFSDIYNPCSTDLVYAVSPNMSGYSDAPNAQVVFNFRHALAKVSVRLSSTNTDLQVKVTNVVIAGLNSRGRFTFPKGNTAAEASTNTVGTWTGQNTVTPITLHMAQAADDIITLTTTPTDMGDTGMGLGGAKYIIPQLLTWRSNGMGHDTYITVMCSVYDAHTGVKLWPNENTPEDNRVEGSTYDDGLLKFPLSTSSFSDFKAGNHYIYNLVINSNDEMGNIEFGTPTVDSYVEVNSSYQ